MDFIPGDTKAPLGKFVRLYHYYDANILHDQLNGSSVTGILRFSNKNLVYLYYKKQCNVEIATHGHEFFSGHTCAENITDLFNIY